MALLKGKLQRVRKLHVEVAWAIAGGTIHDGEVVHYIDPASYVVMMDANAEVVVAIASIHRIVDIVVFLIDVVAFIGL